MFSSSFWLERLKLILCSHVQNAFASFEENSALLPMKYIVERERERERRRERECL